MITAIDAKNTLIFLDRVDVKGLQEVQILAILSSKLSDMVNAELPKEEDDGAEDTDTTD